MSIRSMSVAVYTGAPAIMERMNTAALQQLPLWDEAVVGASWHFSALWASVVPMLGVSVLLLSVKRLRGLLVGLALGWAAYLLVSAVMMPSDVLFIPGTSGMLDRVWLVLNGGLLLVLARLIAITQRSTR